MIFKKNQGQEMGEGGQGRAEQSEAHSARAVILESSATTLGYL